MAAITKRYHIELFPEQELTEEEAKMDANTLMLYLDRFCKDNFEGRAYEVVVIIDVGLTCPHCGQDWITDEVGRPLCCPQAALEWSRAQVRK